MFRSSTILRELVQSMAKVIFQFKHSVKLRRMYFVAACHGTGCVLFVVKTDTEYQYAQHTARTPLVSEQYINSNC